MRNQFLLSILGMYCLFLAASSQLNAAPSKRRLSFSAAAARARLAIKHSDLKAFQRLCARQVVVVEQNELHLVDLSNEDQKLLPGMFDITKQDNRHPLAYTVQSTTLLNLDQPLSRQDRRLLKAFFDTICVAEKGRGEEMGPNLVGRGVEGADQFGTALQGEVDPGRSWRLGFENMSGRWEIRYVTVAYDE